VVGGTPAGGSIVTVEVAKSPNSSSSSSAGARAVGGGGRGGVFAAKGGEDTCCAAVGCAGGARRGGCSGPGSGMVNNSPRWMTPGSAGSSRMWDRLHCARQSSRMAW
jgi:hypothetical protein